MKYSLEISSIAGIFLKGGGGEGEDYHITVRIFTARQNINKVAN